MEVNPDYLTDDEIRKYLITCDYKGCAFKAVIVEYLLSIKKLWENSQGDNYQK